MRHDLQLKAVLSAYKLPILRAVWALDPEGCRDEVVQACSDDLGLPILGANDKPGPARRRGIVWHRHLAHALQELVYGHSAFERRYEYLPNGRASLVNLGQRPPWTIAAMDIGTDGVMRSIMQTTQAEPIPADRLVWYVTDQEGSNWSGVSPMRAAFGAWLLKHEGWRVNATSIRRFGMGVPIVEAPQGGDATQVAQAAQMAAAMRAGDQAGIGLPNGFRAYLQGIQGGAPDNIAWIRYLDQSIAKSAMAGLLELGQTETGSRALGETFLDLFLLSIQSVADDIATVATSGHPGMPGIVTDLVDQNWGPDEPAPRIVCQNVGENYDISASALQALTLSGVITPDPALDEWARKTWRLPKRTDKWVPSSRGIPAGTSIKPNVETQYGQEAVKSENVPQTITPSKSSPSNTSQSTPGAPGKSSPNAQQSGNPQPKASAADDDDAETERIVKIAAAVGTAIARELLAKFNPDEPRDPHSGKWVGKGIRPPKGTPGANSPFYNDVPETRGVGRSKGNYNGPTGRDLADREKQRTQVQRVAEPITEKEARDDSRPVSADEFQQLAGEGLNQLARLRAMRSDPKGLRDNLDAVKEKSWAETRKSWGGLTVDAHTGQPLESNADKYALSVKKADMHTVSLPENASRQQLDAAIDAAVKQFGPALAAAQSYLGVFHDDEEHRIDIDPVLVVDTPGEVERIGAYAHSVGGAYHFRSGNGLFPPHVKGLAAAAGEGTVHFDGPGQWRSQADAAQPGLSDAQEAAIEQAAGISALFNPAELRDWHGRWAGLGGKPGKPLGSPGRHTFMDLKPGDKLLAKVDAKLAKGNPKRPPVPGHRESTARVADHMARLVDQHGTLQAGKDWYPDEHRNAVARAGRYGVPVEVAAAVESATSPRTAYATNQRVTDEILAKLAEVGPEKLKELASQGKVGGGILKQFRDDGIAIAAGGPISEHLGGPKRRPFYDNIMFPGQTDEVTIDTWMNQQLRALGLSQAEAHHLATERQAGLAGGIGQVIVADATRQAAQAKGVSPDAMQAAVWIASQAAAGVKDMTGRGAKPKGLPADVTPVAASAAGFDPWTADPDRYDAELLIEYLTWLSQPGEGKVDLGAPASAREDGSLAADNEAAWKIVLGDSRFRKLGLTPQRAHEEASVVAANWIGSLHPRDSHGRFRKSGFNPALKEALRKEALNKKKESAQPKYNGPKGVPVPPDQELAYRQLWHSQEGVTDPTAEEVQAASNIWYSHRYGATNAQLRHGDVSQADPGFQHDVQAFEGLINRSPAFTQWAQMFHGMSGSNEVFGPPGQAVGKTVTDRGFTSLSADYVTAEDYSDGDAVVKVHVPPGAHAYRADQQTWRASGNGSQYPLDSVQEYTTAPGSRFAVIKDTPANPSYGMVRAIDVVLLPPSGAPAAAPVKAAASKQLPGLPGLPGGQRFGWRPGELEVDR